MKRINIAVVGLVFGRMIIKELQNGKAKDFFNLVAVCDIDESRVKKNMKEFGISKGYNSVDELLMDDDIPTLALITGPNGRADLISKIINAGKDVITTKPFENNPEKVFEIFDEAKKLGRTVHVNSPGPQTPEYINQILEWQKEYNLGQPIGCRAETWKSVREVNEDRWIDDPELCPVAPVTRIGIYMLNDLIRLFGEAEKVTTLESKIFTKRPTADNGQVSILFKNKLIANLFVSFCVDDGQWSKSPITINYENGTLYKNIDLNNETILPYQTTLRLVINNKDEKDGNPYKVISKILDYAGSGGYQWENFYKAINGETIENMVEPKTIAESIKVFKAMKASSKSGSIEQV